MSFARPPRVVLSLGMAALLGLLAVPARAVTIDWVTVGDPGNPNDTINTGTTPNYGAVADAFQIMKFEFTNQQYTHFLNSVDPNGTNPNSVYSESGQGGTTRGGITNTGTTNGSRYAVKPDMGDKPVNYVNWFDAARVSNWLMNGATGTSSMETGAYTLNNATSGNAPAVNPGATFYIPTENQWYKAAYYKGGSTNAGYWTYATQSDAVPTAVTAGLTGSGSSGSTGNYANYGRAAGWNGQNGNVTTVGTNGGASAYGAFDMSGNVNEWNDLTGDAGSSRGLRAGSWFDAASTLSSPIRSSINPSSEFVYYGLRLASPVPVPEPATSCMALAGLACGCWMLRRQKPAGGPRRSSLS